MENQNQNSGIEISDEQKAALELEEKTKAEAEEKAKLEAEEKAKLEAVKPAPVNAAPRHAGKANVKKARSYADIEAKKQLDSVKLWSKDILEAQLDSKVCSPEMKKACAEELKKREEFRKSKLKK